MPDRLLFTAVAERNSDLVALISPLGKITYLNAAGRHLLGTSGEGLPFSNLLMETDALRFDEGILPACIDHGVWEGILAFRDLPLAGASPAVASFVTVSDDDGEGGFHIVCTAQSRREDSIHIERQERMLEAATQIASDILASQSGIEALEHFAEAARQLTGARYAAIGVASANGEQLEAFVTTGLTREQEQVIGKRPRGAGILGLLLARTAPLRLNDLSQHPASVGFPPHHPPMNAFLGVPIRHGEEVLGSLYLTEKEDGFDEVDEVTVFALGAHLAVAIRNLQMLKRQRALVSGLIAAQEEERRAVAYDLHDGLTQYVMAAQMHLSVFRGALQRGEVTIARDNLRTAFDSAYKYLADSVIESRRLVNGLRSLALDDMGLAGALDQLIAEEKMRAGWKEADFVHNLGSDRFSQTLETALYRIAQEGLTNIRKHANADRVQVILLLQVGIETPDQLSLTIHDNGQGFVPSTRNADYSHIGLHGIAERARLLQGQLQIESELGQGTRLTVQFPVFPHEDSIQNE